MNIRPKDIHRNSKLRIVSPAGAIDPQLIYDCKEQLERQGFSVEVGKNAAGKHFVFSGTVNERVEDMQVALDDPETDLILCARGGYGTVQIIDKLDFTAFIKNPKWLVGFSDITVFHLHLAHLGIASLHADMPINYAQNPHSLNEVLKILEGENPSYIFPKKGVDRVGESVDPCSGLLTGGNLSIINGLRATPYDLIPEGSILFLEDLNEDLYHIERLLQNLRLGGIFEKINGLIIGQFTDLRNDPPLGKSLEQVILDLTKDYHYPILFDFPAGHVPNNKPLIMGLPVELLINEDHSTLRYL